MKTHAKSLTESYENSHFTTSDKNCSLTVSSFSHHLPCHAISWGHLGLRSRREKAGRRKVAGRGWRRPPGAELGVGARGDGAVDIDGCSPVTEDTRRAVEDSSGHSLHWVQRTLHPLKVQFSIFILARFWDREVLNQCTLLNENLSSTFFSVKILVKSTNHKSSDTYRQLCLLRRGPSSPNLQLQPLSCDGNAHKSGPTDPLPATQMLLGLKRAPHVSHHLHNFLKCTPHPGPLLFPAVATIIILLFHIHTVFRLLAFSPSHVELVVKPCGPRLRISLEFFLFLLRGPHPSSPDHSCINQS